MLRKDKHLERVLSLRNDRRSGFGEMADVRLPLRRLPPHKTRFDLWQCRRRASLLTRLILAVGQVTTAVGANDDRVAVRTWHIIVVAIVVIGGVAGGGRRRGRWGGKGGGGG